MFISPLTLGQRSQNPLYKARSRVPLLGPGVKYYTTCPERLDFLLRDCYESINKEPTVVVASRYQAEVLNEREIADVNTNARLLLRDSHKEIE